MANRIFLFHQFAGPLSLPLSSHYIVEAGIEFTVRPNLVTLLCELQVLAAIVPLNYHVHPKLIVVSPGAERM